MAASILDYYCRGFQPNTFDPSRCGSCLRPDYMHLNISPDKEAEQKLNAEVDDDASDLSEVITVSSDDISGGWTYEWSLGHSLSPEWELNICDTHIQPRCPGFWDNSPRTRSQNSERYIDDMTRFNPSPQRSTDSPCMDDRRGRNRSRRPSENCERERGFLSPDRRENSNLESISHQSKQRSYEGSHSSTRTAVNSAVPTHTRNSRDVSPSRNGYGTRSNSPHKENGSRESMLSPLQGSWQGSSHSLLSNPASRGSSSSMRKTDIHMLAPEPVFHAADVPEVNRSYDRSRSSGRRGMDALLISESKKTAEIVEEVGMTIDDYIELADIPKIYLESEEEYVGLRKRNQSPSPCRNQRNKSERYTDETLVDSSRLDSDYRGRVRNMNNKMTYAITTDTVNLYVKAWLSFLDEHGKWRKHWFVLGESSVRYYRDSEAEESEDPEGEIDLRSCLDVSDCDVQKNYGFQLHTKKTVFTLSAMTSKIRRNWVKLLKQAIQNKSHQSETGSEKADPLSQRRSPCQPSSQFTEESRHKPAVHSHQDLSQREEGEGWDREQAKRLEERNKCHSKADVFQKEQVESIEKDHSALGVVVDSPCGPGAPCRAKLEAMVESHQRELQQLREKHDQEIRELKEEQENMLKEVNQASAKALEKLKAMHLEEMEKVKERSQGEERTVEPPQNV
uniref:PH domain-containing protein n=1 Tax=Knipowitschia caucasica TaxID=637954 RepID=A0AAV2LME6_KNICA